MVSKQFRRPLAIAHPGPAAVISLRRFIMVCVWWLPLLLYVVEGGVYLCCDHLL